MRRCSGILSMLIVLTAGALLSRTSYAAPPRGPQSVQVVLYPAAEPRPALKYRLLPPFLERRPGNAAVWWNRLPAERTAFLLAFDKAWPKINEWLEIPLGDRREKTYRERWTQDIAVTSVCRADGMYADMERAARFESCDWELPLREGNVFEMLLPEVQQCRMFARILQTKAHVEIAQGKYDEAVRTLQTGYALSRNVAQGQTLVNGLVGVTIAGMMSREVQQLVQQPDAPNLYWAVSTLPRPAVDCRPGMEAESGMLYLQFPELKDRATTKYSAAEWGRLLRKTLTFVVSMDREKAVDGDFLTVLLALDGYPKARRSLMEHGYSVAEIDAMPIAQVILLYSMRLWDEASDNEFKWSFLPASEIGDGLRVAENRMFRLRADEIIPLLSLLSAVRAAKTAETRCEWHIAALRVFEAMRLYAANHAGRWPDRLSDITEVPVPNNPFDGKPFFYHREGSKAVLSSEKGPVGVPSRFEITLMQNKK